MGMLVHDYLQQSAARSPEKTAIICGEQKITYAAFLQNIRSLSGRLSEEKISKGDRVLIWQGDKARFLASVFAVMARGGIAVPLADGTAFSTLLDIQDHCRPSLLLTGRREQKAHPRLNQLRCPIRAFEDLESGGGSPTGPQGGRTHETDGALILYTSGTTARKKGVLLSHRNLVYSALHINEFMRIDDSILEYVGIPLTHSFGFGRSRCVLFVGGTLAVHNGSFNPFALVRSVERHRVNALSTVPSGFALFSGRLEPLLQKIGPAVRWIEIGSAPMPRAAKERLLGFFPRARICMHYGLTEASRSTFIEFSSERHKLDTAGRPSPHVALSIHDTEGNPVPPGKQGEIVIRGRHVASGYWGDKALTQRMFTKAGALKTGDTGFLDEDGYVHLLGREDDIINMGGEKISPLEVEQKVREVYAGVDICVLGIPDPRAVVGEIPVLCYVPEQGRTLTREQLHRDLAGRLDAACIPKEVFPVARLPKTSNGKVKRRELRQTVASGSARHESHR